MRKKFLVGIVSAALFVSLAWSASSDSTDKSDSAKASDVSTATASVVTPQQLPAAPKPTSPETKLLPSRNPAYGGPPLIDPDPCPTESSCSVDICLDRDNGASEPCAPHDPTSDENTGMSRCQRGNGDIMTCTAGKTVHAITRACWCSLCHGYCNFGPCTSNPGVVQEVSLVCE